MRPEVWSALLSAVLLAAGCGGSNTQPQGGTPAPGAERTAKTTALETAADVVQSKAPVEQISMYLNGFHVAKDDSSMIMESNHYCNQVNEDFAQCVLFDGNGKDARLNGVEYIISEKLYERLPPEERMYWHPHNYEILSGELVMPGLPEPAETEALRGKVNSYGKTWHFWNTGVQGRPADPLPYGPPHLAWSFNHDGEIPPELVRSRDERMDVSTAERREQRIDLSNLTRPQGGVNALAGKFPDARGAPPGVTDNADASARPVPTFGVKSGERSPRD
jgi:hypothetical protein